MVVEQVAKAVAHIDQTVSGYAHLGSALAFYIIGFIILWFATSMWREHPINRVFRMGPFVTEQGLRALLHMWPLFVLFGAFVVACAVDHTLDFLVHVGAVASVWSRTAAVTEAVISLGTAFFLVAFLIKNRRATSE